MNLKKSLAAAFVLFVFTSCSSLDISNIGQALKPKDKHNVEEIINQKNDKVSDFNNFETIAPERTFISENEVAENLGYIKNNLREKKLRIDDEVKNSYRVYMGETLRFRLDRENSAKLLNPNPRASTKIAINNDYLSFMTIYRGNYNLALFDNGQKTRTVLVEVLPKNVLAESNIYDIIQNNFNKNNKILEDAITLYKTHYPNGQHYTRLNYYLLKYAENKNNVSMMKEGLNGLKNNLAAFSLNEQKDIIRLAIELRQDLQLPLSIYTNRDAELQELLKQYIMLKANKNTNDRLFLEQLSQDKQEDKQAETTADRLKEERKNINLKKDSKENNTLDALKKKLLMERNPEKKAKLYYDIGKNYLDSGNKTQAKKYLIVVVRQFANTKWARQSQELLKNIK